MNFTAPSRIFRQASAVMSGWSSIPAAPPSTIRDYGSKLRLSPQGNTENTTARNKHHPCITYTGATNSGCCASSVFFYAQPSAHRVWVCALSSRRIKFEHRDKSRLSQRKTAHEKSHRHNTKVFPLFRLKLLFLHNYPGGASSR